MSKWHVFVALVLVFNVLMGVVLVWTNNFMWDSINAEIEYTPLPPSMVGDVNQMVYSISYSGFTVTVSSRLFVNGEYTPSPLLYPLIIPNYPYILFWVCMLGNLGFIALALVLRNKESRLKP